MKKRIVKLISDFYKNKYLKFVVIPFILLGFYFLASVFFNNKVSFSILTYSHPSNSIKTNSNTMLLKGDKISGRFVAKDNNLGIVFVKFEDYVKHSYESEDILVFRIKNVDEKDWFYFNNYRSGLLERQLLFPFGFPPISNSMNKTYEFEIESLFGNTSNAVRLSQSPQLMTGYQYNKGIILANLTNTAQFLVSKIISSYSDPSFILSSLIYLLPLVFYSLLILAGKYFQASRLFTALVVIAILCETFLLKEFFMGTFGILLALWLVAQKISHLHLRANLILAFFLTIIWVLSMLFGFDYVGRKLNLWVFSLLIIVFVPLVSSINVKTRK